MTPSISVILRGHTNECGILERWDKQSNEEMTQIESNFKPQGVSPI